MGTSLEAWEYYFDEANHSLVRRFLLNFGLYHNISSLFDTTTPRDYLECLDGIRFFSMSWVFMGHFLQFFVLLAFPIRNWSWFYHSCSQSYAFDAVRNPWVSVDSFFLISGILVSYLTLKELDRNPRINYPMMYTRRYLRYRLPVAVLIISLINHGFEFYLG